MAKSSRSINEHTPNISKTNWNDRKSRCKNGEYRKETNEPLGTRNIGNENDNRNSKNNKIDNNKERPWKVMLQNMGGLITENSKDKVDFLKEYVKEDNIILLNLTETWLDSTIEEIAEIEKYKIFRADRKNRVRGGTAIYLHDDLEANILCEKSNGTCEMIAINSNI